MELGWQLAAGSNRSSAASASVRPVSRVSLSMTVSITSGGETYGSAPVETRTRLCLRNRRVPIAGSTQCRAHDARNVSRRTHVGSSGLQSGRPHFFVGYTMGTHDAGTRKIVRKMLDFRQRSGFNIQDGDIGAVFRHAITQLRHRPNLLN